MSFHTEALCGLANIFGGSDAFSGLSGPSFEAHLPHVTTGATRVAASADKARAVRFRLPQTSPAANGSRGRARSRL